MLPQALDQPLAGAPTKVQKGFRSTQFDEHQNVLRTALDALGIHHYPGKSATAADMHVF